MAKKFYSILATCTIDFKIFLLIFSFGLLLSSCQEDEIELTKNHEENVEFQVYNPNINVSTLTGIEISNIVDEISIEAGLDPKINNYQKIKANNIKINTASIKRVMSKDGSTTYSFDVEVPETADNIIYNLIVEAKHKRITNMSFIQIEVDPENLEEFLTSNDNLDLLKGSITTYSFQSFMENAKLNMIGRNEDCPKATFPTGSSTGGSGVTPPGESFTFESQGISATAHFSHQSLAPDHSYNYSITINANGVVHTATTEASSLDVVFSYDGNLNTWTSPIGISSVNFAIAAGDPCVYTLEVEKISENYSVVKLVLDCGNSKKSSVSSKIDPCLFTSSSFSINTASKTIRKLDYYLPNLLNETELALLEKYKAQAQTLFIDYFLNNGVTEETQKKVLEDIKKWVDELPLEDKIFDEDLDECLDLIMSEIKELTTGMSEIIDKLDGDDPLYVWHVASGSVSADGSAVAESEYGGPENSRAAFTVFDSSSYPRATDLSWAKTILHEAVHAYLVLVVRNDRVVRQDYSDLLRDYRQLTFPSMNDAQHNEFVKSFVDKIAISLEEYGQSKEYGLSSQFYGDLAWGGLTHWKKRDSNGDPIKRGGKFVYEETPWFKNKFPTSTERQRVLDNLQIELTGRDNEGNNRQQKGTDAGC